MKMCNLVTHERERVAGHCYMGPTIELGHTL